MAAPVLLDAGLSVRSRAAADTPATLDVHLVNNTGTGNAFAYVTGQAIDNGNTWCLPQSDGHTVYFPASPSGTVQPLGADCSIPLGSPGSTTTITIPHLAGGRIWFSIGDELQFFLNPGPNIVMPSVANPSDPNINTRWGFCELPTTPPSCSPTSASSTSSRSRSRCRWHRRTERRPWPVCPTAGWRRCAAGCGIRPRPTAATGPS